MESSEVVEVLWPHPVVCLSLSVFRFKSPVQTLSVPSRHYLFLKREGERKGEAENGSSEFFPHTVRFIELAEVNMSL